MKRRETYDEEFYYQDLGTTHLEILPKYLSRVYSQYGLLAV